MLDVAMAEIGLQRAGIVSLIRQCIAAGVPEHVRVGLEASLASAACAFHHAGEASGAEGCSSLDW